MRAGRSLKRGEPIAIWRCNRACRCRSNSPQKCRLKNPQLIMSPIPRARPGDGRRIDHPIPLCRTRGSGAVIKLGEVVMILDLHRQGLTVSAIARELGLDRKTVRKCIKRGLEAPVYGPRKPRQRLIDPFVRYLRERATTYPGLTGRRLLSGASRTRLCGWLHRRDRPAARFVPPHCQRLDHRRHDGSDQGLPPPQGPQAATNTQSRRPLIRPSTRPNRNLSKT